MSPKGEGAFAPSGYFLANLQAMIAVISANSELIRLAKLVINSIKVCTSFLWFNYTTLQGGCQLEKKKCFEKLNKFLQKTIRFGLSFLC